MGCSAFRMNRCWEKLGFVNSTILLVLGIWKSQAKPVPFSSTSPILRWHAGSQHANESKILISTRESNQSNGPKRRSIVARSRSPRVEPSSSNQVRGSRLANAEAKVTAKLKRQWKCSDWGYGHRNRSLAATRRREHSTVPFNDPPFQPD